MKKVRFESPDRRVNLTQMSDNECHSPRPYLERQIQANAPGICYEYPRLLTYSCDPVQRFETSNSSPYPSLQKTSFSVFEKDSSWCPSNDLELSMLDASGHEPRRPSFCKSILKPSEMRSEHINQNNQSKENFIVKPLSSIENQINTPPDVLSKDHDFFLRRDKLGKLHIDDDPVGKFGKLSFGKENNPVVKKAEIMKNMFNSSPEVYCKTSPLQPVGYFDEKEHCNCNNCAKLVPNVIKSIPMCTSRSPVINSPMPLPINASGLMHYQCPCTVPPQSNNCTHCNHHIHPVHQNLCHSNEPTKPKHINAVDKKTWAIERFEEGKKAESMEVEKQTNVAKEKREPTVTDLFKIIKLQNEQLQLLQEKVDKFITATKVQNHSTDNYADQILQHIDNEHKISIGVMTSFEMVRTSTIINKEVVKSCDNAQIQCNRSQISIKGVVSNTPVNFLEGITRAEKSIPIAGNANVDKAPVETLCEEKTLNEQSLYNVQVDNATTPMMSPEQTLYLDVRDYSDSDSGSDDRSNVGWTYYNKVMTHVNGMLHDSDMPSSASAMCRSARQRCMQMQIDKTNVSVTKRVKFGDDPLGIHQPHIYAAPTDTSLKMNQLAAKYLKNGPPVLSHRPMPKPAAAPIDMSFATRNYMERHKLLQGTPHISKAPPGEMPRFLDITALKQQPKFL